MVGSGPEEVVDTGVSVLGDRHRSVIVTARAFEILPSSCSLSCLRWSSRMSTALVALCRSAPGRQLSTVSARGALTRRNECMPGICGV